MLWFFMPIFLVALVWSLAWKGVALWKSARNSQNVWFVVLLILSTVGILDILYICFFQENKGSQKRRKK